jgi:ABC-type cobalamin transport system ATPase subunit
MTEMGSVGTLGGMLASRRRRRLASSILHLHRPGGVGKTRLLDGLAGPAADTGASVPDDLCGKGRPAEAIDLLGTVARF